MYDFTPCLRYATLAPSGHNTQPWRFRLTDDAVELLADRTRALPVADPDDRELIISCGAALLNLRLAMLHFGHEPVVRLFPDGADRDLLARVAPGAPRRPTDLEDALFHAIPLRHTNRNRFEERAVPEWLLESACGAARHEKARLHIVGGEREQERLAELIAEGDRIQGANRCFRRELAQWVHPNRTHSLDGMPGYAHGLGDVLSLAGPFVIRTFDWGAGQAAMDRQLVEGSAALAVLSTDLDYSEAWLDAGQALERVLLRLRSEEVWASFLNQPVEVPELRPRLRELTGGDGFPQLVLRFGYGAAPKATPRRELASLMAV